MKLQHRTIRFQILAAFALLALPLAILAYYIMVSHSTFAVAMDKTFQQQEVMTLTSNLQRDIMDLQRNALIYKSSASSGSMVRVEKLYLSLNQSINKLSQSKLMQQHRKNLANISRHLTDYKNNFDVVVDYRQQKNKLLEDLFDEGEVQRSRLLTSLDLPEKNNERIRSHLLAAKSNSLSFIATNDAQAIDEFKLDLSKAREQIELVNTELPLNPDSVELIEGYEEKLLRIVNLTRSYTYLVSVVMAGSAHEILFQTNYLVERSTQNFNHEYQTATNELTQSRYRIISLSTVGVALAIFVPFYFFRSITRPIRSITEVFKTLSTGEPVAEIPGKDREDEIGLLAAAADVFKAKNEQTIALLRHAEHSIDVQQKLNAELSEAKSRAEKALSVKTKFLANMTHELRTPLNSVIGYTVRLLKSPREYDERELLALRTIERNGRHLLSLINDILDISKLEAEKMELKYQPFDINELCQEVVERMFEACEDKGLTLEFCPLDDTVLIESDRLRLTQILNNLLSNAVKYTEKGWIKLELFLPRDGENFHIRIEDSGIGIKSENIARLFNRFEQFDQGSRFKIGQGTGLGLAIVANLCHLFGGSIDVASQYGEGSCFVVSLPRWRPQQRQHALLNVQQPPQSSVF